MCQYYINIHIYINLIINRKYLKCTNTTQIGIIHYVSVNARYNYIILLVTLSYSMNLMLTTLRPLFQLFISIETCFFNLLHD